MAEVKFTITKTIGILSEGSKGWRKEINLVSWNDRKPKVDIRDWGPEHDKIGKGITLNADELRVLQEILPSINPDDL
jgi:hypothetical protein